MIPVPEIIRIAFAKELKGKLNDKNEMKASEYDALITKTLEFRLVDAGSEPFNEAVSPATLRLNAALSALKRAEKNPIMREKAKLIKDLKAEVESAKVFLEDTVTEVKADSNLMAELKETSNIDLKEVDSKKLNAVLISRVEDAVDYEIGKAALAAKNAKTTAVDNDGGARPSSTPRTASKQGGGPAIGGNRRPPVASSRMPVASVTEDE
jgi:hypothetical protein